MTDPVNAGVAARLDEVAALLEEQGANPFRVAAYRRAAQTLRALPTPVADVLRNEGMEGLRPLPGAGTSLARSTRGPLRGRRIVRGREAECEQFYRSEVQRRAG